MQSIPEPHALRNGPPESPHAKQLEAATELVETALRAIDAAMTAIDGLEDIGHDVTADELYRRMCNYCDATPDLEVYKLERRLRELEGRQ